MKFKYFKFANITSLEVELSFSKCTITCPPLWRPYEDAYLTCNYMKVPKICCQSHIWIKRWIIYFIFIVPNFLPWYKQCNTTDCNVTIPHWKQLLILEIFLFYMHIMDHCNPTFPWSTNTAPKMNESLLSRLAQSDGLWENLERTYYDSRVSYVVLAEWILNV